MLSLKPTIPDIDQASNEYGTNKAGNRADFLKRNETLAEIVEF